MKKIIVLTGTSGVGKTTISHYLAAAYHIPAIITHTTRPPRSQEKNGVDYYFESAASFAQQDLIEQVSYAGYRYGSSIQGLQQAWRHANVASIILDPAGAQKYYERLGQRVLFWFIVADVPVLTQRLQQRGDDAVQLKQRLQSQEFLRDLQVPVTLQSIATIIPNNDWRQTQQQLARLVQPLVAQTD